MKMLNCFFKFNERKLFCHLINFNHGINFPHEDVASQESDSSTENEEGI